ncbi:Hypothetical predicted protein [Paramuricea clavata]|uniref:Uncharacterized protein n=1 Tax=Paramuricea clavata TaxID=317549 RepID=A0A7D9IQU0_PARCT|nr:Hypothetical predicted protein [Paramuricea clavata]
MRRYAGNDVINFLRKTDNYRQSLGLDKSEEDDVPPAAGPPPATARPSGANHKPGTVASSTAKIEEHLRKNGVKPIADGVKFKDGQIGVSYNDMMEDLTRNYVQTQPNLDPKGRYKVLLLLKQTNMPISFIRNKKIKEEYKTLLAQGHMTPLRPIAKRRLPTPDKTPIKPLRRPRDYLYK